MRRRHIRDDERRSRLAERHRLAARARTDDVVAIARGLVGLHSSDPATVYLSAMARMASPSPEGLEQALYTDRHLVRHHAMRRTIWVFPVDTAEDAHASTTVRYVESETRRLARIVEDNDVTDDGVAYIEAASESLLAEVEARGITTTRELGDALPEFALTLRAQGATLSSHSRVLLIMGFKGDIVRTRPMGTWISSQYGWAPMQAWLPGAFASVDESEAAVRMVERYVAAFGPVTATDLSWWTGWSKTAVRSALETATVDEVVTDDGEAWMPSGVEEARSVEPWAALLPGLDPTVMGWKDRDWYLDPAHTPTLFDRNGNAGPTVWVDGRVVGGWAQLPTGEIRYRLLEPVTDDQRDLIDIEVDRTREMYGDIRHKVRFPAPLQKELVSAT